MLTLNDLEEGELFLFHGEMFGLVSKHGNGMGIVKKLANVAGRLDLDDSSHWPLETDTIDRLEIRIA